MRERGRELDRLNAVVLGITFERSDHIAHFVAREHVPFQILSDPARRLYRAFGLERANATQIWSRETLGFYLRELLRGQVPRRPRGDLHQLGGDAVLDQAGRIVLIHRSQNPTDRPTVDEIIAALSSALEPNNG